MPDIGENGNTRAHIKCSMPFIYNFIGASSNKPFETKNKITE